ncbi:hypothetical protein EVJ50_04590 [Synechococcus sp. RSCCF101]|uniref:hypothetical protein n=1 Tax=Synechococcus sp. RSCCF101 TaxID=2511069 RepID=UPI001244BB6F|nr:hypothetical protein [Synechococcus sp. RSCCF101]QEY31638.1 hypothetical protein EVJ50_04590 [Synechococcus sp. RSCCF101]
MRRALLLLRMLIWIVALTYLAIEIREVMEVRQVVHATIFALFFLIAAFQLGSARFLLGLHKPVMARCAFRAAICMFAASLFDAIDTALDSAVGEAMGEIVPGLLGYAYFGGSALVVVAAIAFAVYSMELYRRILNPVLLGGYVPRAL